MLVLYFLIYLLLLFSFFIFDMHYMFLFFFFFFFSSRRRHTRSLRDWSSDVCSSDLRTGDSPRSVLVIGHQAEKIYRFRYRPQIISSAPVPVNPRGESRLAWIDRKSVV